MYKYHWEKRLNALWLLANTNNIPVWGYGVNWSIIWSNNRLQHNAIYLKCYWMQAQVWQMHALFVYTIRLFCVTFLYINIAICHVNQFHAFFEIWNPARLIHASPKYNAWNGGKWTKVIDSLLEGRHIRSQNTWSKTGCPINVEYRILVGWIWSKQSPFFAKKKPPTFQ